MSATLTTPETNIPVSNPDPAPETENGRWFLAAATAAVATLVAVGLAVSGPTVDDGSHQFAETQRQTALAPVQTPDVSSETAEFQRMLALSVPTVTDVSSEFAVAQRMSALAPQIDGSSQHVEDLRFAAIGAGVDNSHQFAETQRQTALAPVQTPDVSSETAEFQRMLALSVPTVIDVSSEFAEAQRMSALAPQIDGSSQHVEDLRFATLDPADD